MQKKFRRGEAIVYYDGNVRTRCYFGGKMADFRVLSPTPGLESGWCVKLSDVETKVFPAPNEHGVYASEHATRLEYRHNSSFWVAVLTLQIGPSEWIATTEFRLGDKSRVAPLTSAISFPTLEEALRQTLIPLLRDLAKIGVGAPNRIIAQPSSRATKEVFQKHAEKAIYELLNALPSPPRSDIIKLFFDRGAEHG